MSYIPYTDLAKETTLTIPVQNSSSNVNERDVVGNKTDNELGNSLYSKLYLLEKHFHSAAKVYPTLDSAIIINKVNSSAWGLDVGYTQIIPLTTITFPFDIHFINLETISSNDQYELLLFTGPIGSEKEIARVSFERGTSATDSSIQCQTELLAANSRISAKLTSLATSSRNISLKLHYHEY